MILTMVVLLWVLSTLGFLLMISFVASSPIPPILEPDQEGCEPGMIDENHRYEEELQAQSPW